MSEVKLKITNLQMRFHRPGRELSTMALEDFNLEVRDGEFITIVGPSGCGKSTLLNIINGLLQPTGGNVQIDGTSISSQKVALGMVFQDAALFPWFTMERNIGYGLECAGASRDEIRRSVEPLIDLVGLAGFGRHFPHELSGGMQQRANLARALAVDPEILLMDEPFAAIDAQTREIMQSELLAIWARSKKTVLFITHSISEAIYLADRVIVMSARPARTVADIRVPFDRPRALSLKHEPTFGQVEKQIWELLEGQVRSAIQRDRAPAAT